MIASLIRHTVVPGHAYSAIDIDSPGMTAVAVAWKADDGWRVADATGRTVAAELTKTRALNLMHLTASRQLDQAATRSLLGGIR